MGLVVGSALANIFAGKKEAINLILLGTSISFLSAIAMLILFLLGSITVWSLFLPVPFIYVGVSLVLSNCASISMTYARNKANGSAMMNFINLGMCVVILLSVEALASHQRLLMPATFVCVFFLMFFIRKYLAHIICQSQKS